MKDAQQIREGMTYDDFLEAIDQNGCDLERFMRALRSDDIELIGAEIDDLIEQWCEERAQQQEYERQQYEHGLDEDWLADQRERKRAVEGT